MEPTEKCGRNWNTTYQFIGVLGVREHSSHKGINPDIWYMHNIRPEIFIYMYIHNLLRYPNLNFDYVVDKKKFKNGISVPAR